MKLNCNISSKWLGNQQPTNIGGTTREKDRYFSSPFDHCISNQVEDFALSLRLKKLSQMTTTNVVALCYLVVLTTIDHQGERETESKLLCGKRRLNQNYFVGIERFHFCVCLCVEWQARFWRTRKGGLEKLRVCNRALVLWLAHL